MPVGVVEGAHAEEAVAVVEVVVVEGEEEDVAVVVAVEDAVEEGEGEGEDAVEVEEANHLVFPKTLSVMLYLVFASACCKWEMYN